MTTPNQSINQFIEANIDEIDNQEYDYIFNEAYISFDNADYILFVNLMKDIGINTLPYQQEVLKDKFQQELDYWGANFPSSNYINLSTFCEDFLANLCGLSFNELCQFVKSVDWNGFYINNSFMIFRKRD